MPLSWSQASPVALRGIRAAGKGNASWGSLWAPSRHWHLWSTRPVDFSELMNGKMRRFWSKRSCFNVVWAVWFKSGNPTLPNPYMSVTVTWHCLFLMVLINRYTQICHFPLFPQLYIYELPMIQSFLNQTFRVQLHGLKEQQQNMHYVAKELNRCLSTVCLRGIHRNITMKTGMRDLYGRNTFMLLIAFTWGKITSFINHFIEDLGWHSAIPWGYANHVLLLALQNLANKTVKVTYN